MHAMYPKPDRSDFRPRFVKDDDGVLDIGWAEGTLSDGRPYRLEYWAQDQVTCLTIFVAFAGLDLADRERVALFLEQEGLVTFRGRQRYASARQMRDASGQEVWSINVVVGDTEHNFVTDGPRAPALVRYASTGGSAEA